MFRLEILFRVSLKTGSGSETRKTTRIRIHLRVNFTRKCNRAVLPNISLLVDMYLLYLNVVFRFSGMADSTSCAGCPWTERRSMTGTLLWLIQYQVLRIRMKYNYIKIRCFHLQTCTLCQRLKICIQKVGYII